MGEHVSGKMTLGAFLERTADDVAVAAADALASFKANERLVEHAKRIGEAIVEAVFDEPRGFSLGELLSALSVAASQASVAVAKAGENSPDELGYTVMSVKMAEMIYQTSTMVALQGMVIEAAEAEREPA